MVFLLAELLYHLHKRFYLTPLETYLLADREINDMASDSGLTMNDIAKLLVGKEC